MDWQRIKERLASMSMLLKFLMPALSLKLKILNTSFRTFWEIACFGLKIYCHFLA
jgi:hypothetical protein